MKLCIPTRDDSGLTARAHDHFGSAPFFTLVDTDSRAVQAYRNAAAGRGTHTGTCHALRQPGLPDFDAVACRSMGQRALTALTLDGLNVFITRKETVTAIVEELTKGRPTRLLPPDACAGGHGEEQHDS